MADNPKDKTPKQNLSDEIVQQVRAQIINGGAGYGRPPKEHQFKKGQPSPNPKGRPKKAAPDLTLNEQPLLKAIHAVLKKKVKARDGDKIVEMPADEALAQAGLNFALKGNARYYGMIVDSGRQAEEARAREIRENHEWWHNYQSIARSAIVEAETKGEAAPEFLPHPDDLVFEPGEMTRFVGPFDDESAERTRLTIAYRDALILQAALDEKLMPVAKGGSDLDGPGTAYDFAILLNRALPPRLRNPELTMLYNVDRYARHPRRWLLKEVYARWRNLRVSRKRGELFPPRRWALDKIRTISNLIAAFEDGRLDANAVANGDTRGVNSVLEDYSGDE